MALRLSTLLCLTALVQLFGFQNAADSLQEVPIKLFVKNNINNSPTKNYDATAKPGGVLIGAMRRLEKSNQDFRFTVSENPDYGYYLESVNGVAGSQSDHTYWQILTDINGSPTPTDVGVGCYIPKAHECIIFNFTTW